MVQILVANYYDLLDKKLENGTLIVLLIALCILLVGAFASHPSVAYAKASILDTKSSQNIVTIDGEKYEIILKKL